MPQLLNAPVATRRSPALRNAAIATVVLLASAIVAHAQTQRVQRGVVIARTYCVQCHSIDKFSLSPLAAAPPFRDLHKKYPVERLEEALAEGVVTGHPAMPEFRFDTDQIGDFIAFLNSLK